MVQDVSKVCLEKQLGEENRYAVPMNPKDIDFRGHMSVINNI
jgi:hypothetical protein